MIPIDYDADFDPALWADCLWGAPDEERYYHSCPEEAIADLLEIQESADMTGALEIVGVRRDVVHGRVRARLAERVLEHLLECLDEDYGDPDECSTHADPDPADASAFVAAVVGRYVVWRCTEVVRVVVDVPAWLAAHPEAMVDPGTEDER